MNCGCCSCDPEPDEVLERLVAIACKAGVHGTRALGHCQHSRELLPPNPVVAALLREGIASLRAVCVSTRVVNRTYALARSI